MIRRAKKSDVVRRYEASRYLQFIIWDIHHQMFRSLWNDVKISFSTSQGLWALRNIRRAVGTGEGAEGRGGPAVPADGRRAAPPEGATAALRGGREAEDGGGARLLVPEARQLTARDQRGSQKGRRCISCDSVIHLYSVGAECRHHVHINWLELDLPLVWLCPLANFVKYSLFDITSLYLVTLAGWVLLQSSAGGARQAAGEAHGSRGAGGRRQDDRETLAGDDRAHRREGANISIVVK